jgi:hypothetical protein
MIFARSGKILHRFAPIAAVQFRAAFSGRSNQSQRKTRIECHGHQRRLAVARNALDPNMPGVHGRIGL